MAQADDEEKALAAVNASLLTHIPASAGSSLLPSSVASFVSLFTQSSSVSLRLGTFIGGLAIDGARITTLTGLELSRAAIETILSKAGKDVASRSLGELGKVEAEGLLERSASFLASTSFHLSTATLTSASTLSQHLLSALDAILGSTESSKSIAAIIILIRREFKNPATGINGERIGVADLLVGLCGFALLQRWGRKKTEQEVMEKNGEKIVWDVVILGNGTRADVVEPQSLDITGEGSETVNYRCKRPSSFMSTSGDYEAFHAVNRDKVDDWTEASPRSLDQGGKLSEATLRSHILQQLPADARVSIDSETVTTRTITVEVSSHSLPVVEPPPGVSVLREEYQSSSDDQLSVTDKGGLSSKSDKAHLSRYKVVYQSIANQFRSASIRPRGPPNGASTFDENHDNVSSMPTEAILVQSESGLDSSPGHEEPRNIAYDRVYRLKSSPVNLNLDLNSNEVVVSKNKRSSTSDDHTNNAANQKRQRKPIDCSSPVYDSKLPLSRFAQRSKQAPTEKTERKTSLRQALKKKEPSTKAVGSHQTNAIPPSTPNALEAKQHRPPWRLNTKTPSPSPSHLPTLQKPISPANTKMLPKPAQRGNPNFFSSEDLGQQAEISEASPRASYYSIRERRRDSVVSQTDTYSVHSMEHSGSTSPNQARMESRTQTSFSRSKSDKDITNNGIEDPVSTSSARRHGRTKSFAPSIYTLATNNSETSLVLSNNGWERVYDESSITLSLSRDGHIPGSFPRAHFVRNLTRFARFSSASYGSSFLRLMGITSASTSPTEVDVFHHHEHHSFSSHTGLPPSTILLSSFVDPQGGTNAAGETESNVPLVHYVSLDHESKAVVLTCRGTLGFEDILTDMTCDYDHLIWRGKPYQVHKGMHASARRLLQGGGGRVMATIRAALEEFPEYGLVMCGHSLGGGVAALLAILLSEPDTTSPSGTSFITASATPVPLLLPIPDSNARSLGPSSAALPSNRPIHVYAYGPPASISPSLRHATRGLITTIVNNQDIVPSLSLGILHDFQAVALAFKTDTSGVKGEFRKRVWEGLSSNLTARFGDYGFPAADDEVEDHWAWASLKALRASMQNPKLLPPGEVFVVETTPVLQRDAFTSRVSTLGAGGGYAGLGRPATRVRLKYIRDVESRFGEIGFGGGMLGDHSPGRYEGSLRMLGRGVLGA
ncbi:MAG: hypothetical protein M1830_008222 [Pleopsidium flavum]|nr:MAG: hypothetical protein M1830_008222 [Pleopsidium flavum]